MTRNTASDLNPSDDPFGGYQTEGFFDEMFAVNVKSQLVTVRAALPELRRAGGSVVLTYWPSEFSQVRGQYRRTAYGDGPTANELAH